MEWNVPEGQAGLRYRCEISHLFNQFTVVKFYFIFHEDICNHSLVEYPIVVLAFSKTQELSPTSHTFT